MSTSQVSSATSTQVQKNPTFWTRLKSLFGRDTYITASGQKICMKSGQGKVEVDENGEVNIFDAINVKAKGVDGNIDVFNLHNCSGPRNRGKKLNDVGDVFRQVSDDENKKEQEKEGEITQNTEINDLLNQIKTLLQSMFSGEMNGKMNSEMNGETEFSAKYEKTTEIDQPTAGAGYATGWGAMFNTIVNGDHNNVNVQNNYYAD